MLGPGQEFPREGGAGEEGGGVGRKGRLAQVEENTSTGKIVGRSVKGTYSGVAGTRGRLMGPEAGKVDRASL